jgi:hypothetical protein
MAKLTKCSECGQDRWVYEPLPDYPPGKYPTARQIVEAISDLRGMGPKLRAVAEARIIVVLRRALDEKRWIAGDAATLLRATSHAGRIQLLRWVDALGMRAEFDRRHAEAVAAGALDGRRGRPIGSKTRKAPKKKR